MVSDNVSNFVLSISHMRKSINILFIVTIPLAIKFVRSRRFWFCVYYQSPGSETSSIDPEIDIAQMRCNKDAGGCWMISTKGQLRYTINTNCGFINFHPRDFWTGRPDSEGVKRDVRRSDDFRSAYVDSCARMTHRE